MEASGTYNGTGATQAINIGFEPTEIYFGNLATMHTARFIPPLTAGQVLAQETGDDVLKFQGGVTILADGFSVGNLQDVNGFEQEINYLAFADDPPPEE